MVKLLSFPFPSMINDYRQEGLVIRKLIWCYLGHFQGLYILKEQEHSASLEA